MGSLATATVVLDDSFLHEGMNGPEQVLDEGSDSNSGCSLGFDPGCSSDTCSDASTCEYSVIATDSEDEHCGGLDEGQDHCSHCKCNQGPCWIRRGYGRQKIFDAGKILGGHNVLQSLSAATSLKLLAGAGEVILNRGLKTCPVFSNLKALSLGEWCMASDFDPLVSFLQHCPNLERLFLELKMHDDTEEVMEDRSIRVVGCANLKMVKIKCSKDETRVHSLAQLFMANGIPVENIYVRQQSFCHYIEPL